MGQRKHVSDESKYFWKELVRLMHEARSENHFDMIGQAGLMMLKRHYGDTDNTLWFEKEYMQAPWDGWWCGAAESEGTPPNNNDIESFWRTMKANMLLSGQRVSATQLFETVSLPLM